jgi:hypothetical protein
MIATAEAAPSGVGGSRTIGIHTPRIGASWTRASASPANAFVPDPSASSRAPPSTARGRFTRAYSSTK